MTINVLSVLNDTTVDGPGFRTAIYCSGCKHHCEGCHNPQSWAFGSGEDRTIDSLIQEIVSDPVAHVTFTGGDPFFQAAGFAELAARVKAETDKTIWCYTGFLFEELLKVPAYYNLLKYLDVVVDGPFIQALRDEDLLFCGSRNQRLIDVQASLKQGSVVLWKRDEDLF